MNANKPKQKNQVVKKIFTPVRRNSKGIIVPIRKVFKREMYTISKDNTKTDKLVFFAPKNEGQEGQVKLLPGMEYGSKNMAVHNNGCLLRVEVNIYNPLGLPFDFHERDTSGKITVDAITGFETGAYKKLKELRKCMLDAKITHLLNLNDVIAEDKLDNYIHAPHIDEKSGRETSIYTRYSSASIDNRLGRVLNIELDDQNVYKFIMESQSLFRNVILDGCEIVVEASIEEDINAKN